MPNWCSNSVTIHGPKDHIEEFRKFIQDKDGKDWFDFFHPCPQELKDVGNVSLHEAGNETLIEKYGYSDWYSWSVDNWGTKWNADANNWEFNFFQDQGTVTFWFDSAWSPPIKLYEWIEENTFCSVVGDYHEEGMCFVGRYEDGFDDFYEYSDLDSLENIPDEIVDNWNLAEMLEERADWDEEEENEQ